MAASGYTPISLYYSSTASTAPTAGNLVNGELAINIRDGKLYYKDYLGVVQVIAGTGGTGVVAGSNTQVQFNNNGVFGASSAFTWDGTTLSATKFAGALNGTVGATTPTTGAFTQVDITGQGDLRLQDTSGGEYVALQAPATLGASYTLTMPIDDGVNGQALITDGSGNLSWSTAASGDVYGPASSTTNGYLTSTDWNTFNNKGSGTVTSVSGTAPISSSGGATPAISISQATTSTNGYLSSTDWNTFNNKATLPSQTGNSGKYLTTDGSATSWGALPTYIPVTNRATSIIQVSVAYGYMPILTRGGTTTNVPTL